MKEPYRKKAWGRREYIKFINGYKITRGEAIKAKCYDCMGQFIDGKFDCLIEDCSLYSYRGYKGKNPPIEEDEKETSISGEGSTVDCVEKKSKTSIKGWGRGFDGS